MAEGNGLLFNNELTRNADLPGIAVLDRQIRPGIADENSDARDRLMNKITIQEFVQPVKLAGIIVMAFWSIFVHGSLPIFMVIASSILLIGVVSVVKNDVYRPSPTLRLPMKIMNIRLTQLSFMYAHFALVEMFSTMFSSFNYFTVYDNRSFPQQILNVFSKSVYDIQTKDYLKISSQVYWFSLSCILLTRMISNLCSMCRTLSFRLLLKYETQDILSTNLAMLFGVAGFNYLAVNYGSDNFAIAGFLVATFIAWVVICLVNSTVSNEDMAIPRENNIEGVLKMLTVSFCQVMISGVLLEAMSLFLDNVLGTFVVGNNAIGNKAAYSHPAPLKGIQNYLKNVKEKTFEQGSQQEIIYFDSELILEVMFIVHVSRTFRHFKYVSRLQNTLTQLGI